MEERLGEQVSLEDPHWGWTVLGGSESGHRRPELRHKNEGWAQGVCWGWEESGSGLENRVCREALGQCGI